MLSDTATPMLLVQHPSGDPANPRSWVCHWSSSVTLRITDCPDEELYRWEAIEHPLPGRPVPNRVTKGSSPSLAVALRDLQTQANTIPEVGPGLELAVQLLHRDPPRQGISWFADADDLGPGSYERPALPSWFTGPGLPPFPVDPQAPSLAAGLRWPPTMVFTNERPPEVKRLFGIDVKLLAKAAARLGALRCPTCGVIHRETISIYQPCPDPWHHDPEGRADPEDPVDLAGAHEVLTTLDATMAADPDELELVPSREAVVRARSEAAALRDIRPAIVVLASMTDPEADPVRHAVYHRELDRLDARLAEIDAGIAGRLAWLERRVAP